MGTLVKGKVAARKRAERRETGNANSDAPDERKASGGMLEARSSRPEWRRVRVYVPDEKGVAGARSGL